MATFFGMFILLMGVFFIFIGQMFPNLQNKGIFCATWIFGGMFIGIGGNPAKDAPDGSPIMVTIGIILAIVGALVLIVPMFLKKELNPSVKIAIVAVATVAIGGVIFSTCNSNSEYNDPSRICCICHETGTIKDGKYYYCDDCYGTMSNIYYAYN